MFWWFVCYRCWSSVRIMVMGCIELFVCESSWIPPDADIVLVSNADKFILSLGYEEMQRGVGTSGWKSPHQVSGMLSCDLFLILRHGLLLCYATIAACCLFGLHLVMLFGELAGWWGWYVHTKARGDMETYLEATCQAGWHGKIGVFFQLWCSSCDCDHLYPQLLLKLI